VLTGADERITAPQAGCLGGPAEAHVLDQETGDQRQPGCCPSSMADLGGRASKARTRDG
jgi:hypothetical protein